MSKIVLECVDLTAGYDGIPVVRGINVAVHEGEVVTLLGPNGAGKTTTLLAMAGVIPTLGGRVLAFGEPVTGGRPHLVARRGVSLVPDDRSLFYGLTAEENIRIAVGKRKVPGIDLVLEFFPALSPKLSVKAGLLSGGEQQMLAVGRALACGAKVLMIDEMSLGLAPVIAKSILPVLRNAADIYGTSVLLVEQHVDLALAIADTAYVLSHGEISLTAPGADLMGNRELIRASYMGTVVA